MKTITKFIATTTLGTCLAASASASASAFASPIDGSAILTSAHPVTLDLGHFHAPVNRSTITCNLRTQNQGTVSYLPYGNALQIDHASLNGVSFSNTSPTLNTVAKAGTNTLSITYSPKNKIDPMPAAKSLKLTTNSKLATILVSNCTITA